MDSPRESQGIAGHSSRVALLTYAVTPHRQGQYIALSRLVSSLQILVSTVREPHRRWPVECSGLNVQQQRCWTFAQKWKHPVGFADQVYVHLPYDTIFRLRSIRPDVVLSVELGFRSLQAWLYKLMRPSCRLILWTGMSEHTEKQRGLARELLRKVLIRAADAHLVNGESGARYLKRFGVSEGIMFPAPYSVDMEPLWQVSLNRTDADRYRLLYIGQLIERKGLVPFLQSLCQWCRSHQNRSVEFDVYGYGPLESTLRSLPTPENLNVTFRPAVEYEDLPRVYASGGIFVLPTFADEWGAVVNEALAAGLPVLGSIYSQAVEELVEDGKHGWRFRPNSPASIEETLTRVFQTSPSEVDLMRTRCRERSYDVTPERIAERVADAIEFVTNGQQRPTFASSLPTH